MGQDYAADGGEHCQADLKQDIIKINTAACLYYFEGEHALKIICAHEFVSVHDQIKCEMHEEYSDAVVEEFEVGQI